MCPSQNGRSMLEMIGVLCIIGVLSIGGIAGYSKAMLNMRINKTVEEVSSISQAVRAFYASRRDYKDLYCSSAENSTLNTKGCDLIKRVSLVPVEMYTDSSKPNMFFNRFGGTVKVAYSGLSYEDVQQSNNKGNKSFTISYRGVPSEECIGLVTQDWQLHPGIIGMTVYPPTSSKANKYYQYLWEGCKGWSHHSNTPDIVAACTDGEYLKFPVRLDIATRICSQSNSMSMDWKFK